MGNVAGWVETELPKSSELRRQYVSSGFRSFLMPSLAL